MKRTILAVIFLAGVAGSVISTELQRSAFASRNSSGTYTLPAGNPVVSGTTISSTVHNNTNNDLASEITNSLDRNGRGAMLAALQGYAGTVGAPGYTFSGNTTSGLYKAANNDLRMSIAGSDTQKWNTSGTYLNGDTAVDASGLNDGGQTDSLRFGSSSSGEGISSRRVPGTGQFNLDFYAGGVNRFTVVNGGGVKIPGGMTTTPGTTITGSYGANFAVDEGSLSADVCDTFTETITGVATGGTCSVSPSSSIGANYVDCYVSGSNTITIRWCALTANNPAATTLYVRVWQP